MADQYLDPIVTVAQDLAQRHQSMAMAGRPAPIAAWSRLSALKLWLQRALQAAAEAEPARSSAAEWLLDNDYMIQRAILQIEEDLPKGFYARLPALDGEARHFPRVYAVAHGLLDASHLQVTFGASVQFLHAYQATTPLKIAELWALPTMLRIACLELLVSAFEQLFPAAPPPFSLGLATGLSHAFDPTECVARAISNLTMITAIQWKDFFDRTSRVQAILRRDPAKIYARMDFETRDRCQHVTETLAERSGLDEWEVAERAIARCRSDPAAPSDHVGYWLIGYGRAEFEDAISSRRFSIKRIGQRLARNAATLYALALACASFIALLLPAFYLAWAEATPLQWLLGMVLSALPASILSVTMVNRAVTHLVSPRVLPKLDFEKRIADDCPTAVAVPVIISSVEAVGPVMNRLEGHYLANPDPILRFVLLSDYADAPRETMAGDGAILTALVEGIAALNKSYGDRFVLLHRSRQHNAQQGCWMGWERKRGKLEQFNRLLLTGDDSAFPMASGPLDALRGTRFVIPADADTRLPPGVVNRLVATLAHPLNQPRFDPQTGRVTAGYTILQPRIEIAPDVKEPSLFTRFFGGDTAIDIYSRAVSDVYQDLLGTGIFVGKGIYDVAAFARSLEGRMPENLILSHDLFEGLHGRVGLASDIIVYEGFPSSYLDHMHRQHRWIRGDWQILPWLLPLVPGPDGRLLHNRLGWFDRFKIFDNLRRSLVPISLLGLLLAGWFVLPGNPLLWTALAVAAPSAELFTDLVTGLARGRRRGVLQSSMRKLVDHGGRWLLAIAFLISDAATAGHAICVTLWRLGSGTHLLEWISAAHVSAHFAVRNPRRAAWNEMWTSPIIAALAAVDLLLTRPAVLPVAAPLIILWFFAPEIATVIGRSRRPVVEEISEADRVFLRKIARRTWLYFETFVRPEDNWLPPDNYQEAPHEEVAHRASPTNVGVMLLAVLTAWRLGYISLAEVEVRLRNTLDTLDRLQRYRGHMLNWYDSRTLQALEPRYASTVDSGNLAVSLVIMAAACREARDAPAFSASAWEGLSDELRLLADALGQNEHVAAMIETVRTAAEGTVSPHQQFEMLTNRHLPAVRATIRDADVDGTLSGEPLREAQLWVERIEHHLRNMRRDMERQLPLIGADTQQLGDQLMQLAQRALDWAHGMDFGFLFDANSRLFHIGYNVSADHIDPHHYDLLASEARLASFFAIAKGDVPFEHWFFLGRPITKQRSGLALVSWNGSMFEYLMPSLFLRSDPATLLGQSDRTAIDMQGAYGRANNIPWGISESAYAEMGPDETYRYHAFGVPGLGLRRGLERDLVVAPYASALALAIRTNAAIRNLRALADYKMVGRYGFYEALDFTPGRAPEGSRGMIVRSYMVHHHGMSIAAIGNALFDNMLVHWFHGDPHVRTVELILNERIPWELPPELARRTARETLPPRLGAIPALHGWQVESMTGPYLHVMGNGRFSTKLGPRCAELSWQGITMARTEDGPWLYARDKADGLFWNAAPPNASDYQIQVHQLEGHQHAHGISITTQIGVAHGGDLEIRQITLVNESARPRKLDLTSYAEVVLAPSRDAARHPAFSKLFVGSEALPSLRGLLFTRRPRGRHEHPPVLLHRLIADDETIQLQGFETDRAAFLGRHGDADFPAAMQRGALTDSVGWTLDPAMALQVSVDLEPGGRRELAFVTIAAATRETALEIAERHTTLASLQWAMTDAETHAERQMSQMGLAPEAAVDAHRLMALLAGPDADRAPPAAPSAGPHGRSDLWSLRLSGDDPILLLRAGTGDNDVLLPFLLNAQKLWRQRGVQTDLAIIHEGAAGYLQPVRDHLLEILRETDTQQYFGSRGGIHFIGIGHADAGAMQTLEAAARLSLAEDAGPLHEQIDRNRLVPTPSPAFAPIGPPLPDEAPGPGVTRRDDLVLDNGFGGFVPESGDYAIHLDPGETTPAPWANVLANEGFGTIVTEAGLGFTWAVNSGENRLTPWSNDPVCDRQSEILYLRDEESAQLWTVAPGPLGDASSSQIRHGVGYSLWERTSAGLDQEMLAFVAPNDPVKLVRLRLHNRLPRARRITATYYAEWLLGSARGDAAPLRRAEFDPATHALLATNPWADAFRERVAFLSASMAPHSMTVSRTDFLGPGGNVRTPQGLRDWDLGGRHSTVGDDCCAAYQVHLDLPPGGTAEVVFALGQGNDRVHCDALVMRYRDPLAAEAALATVQSSWAETLDTVTVTTPDPAFDLLVNRWLPYQAISARIRARAGFYQAGGAFGFRDQLQDVLALLHSDPARARRHIIEAAAHQFSEGDVLHWWHPPGGAGVRTRCSDDLLWLPYAVATYVEATGDRAILSEQISFLQASPLSDDEEDRYAAFPSTDDWYTLFEHVERALNHAYALGGHGLPLIGSGDWNDGMDRVGAKGRGESVWLGWFMISVIHGFLGLCEGTGRDELIGHWRTRADDLARAIEAAAWDGEWYVRAFDDEGRAWGTASETECRIDSIAQSWAQLSGAGDPDHVRRALLSARQYLVRSDDQLVRLLTPPFDATPRDPGYIKAYPPGIRENGGQYTHAAAWLGMALARSGDGDGAMDIFRRINPIHQTATREDALAFRTEPYVLAADVAGAPPHAGRGGWSWYTGAAAWTWRFAVEEILGLRLMDGKLNVAPHLPSSWPGYEVTLRRPTGSLHLTIDNPGDADIDALDLIVNGEPRRNGAISWPTDGSTIEVRLMVRPAHAEIRPSAS